MIRGLRCEHCGKQYVHYDKRTTVEYCEECYTAMKEALSSIPVKFVGMFQEIDKDSEEAKFVYSKCEEMFKSNTCYYESSDFKCKEEIRIGSICYNVYNRDCGEVKIERLDEYDNIEKKFTGKPWDVTFGISYRRSRGFDYCDMENGVVEHDKKTYSFFKNK